MDFKDRRKNRDNRKDDRRRCFGERERAEERNTPPDNYIYGRNAVKELLESGRDIEKIFVQQGEREGSINLLVAQAAEKKIPITQAEKTRLDKMAGSSRHQGIIAVASEGSYSSVEEILEYAESRKEAPFIVVLDGVEDPHNLGAIIRSAECAGVHGIIIPKRRAVGLTSTVAKVSAGALMHMRVAKVTNISVTIDELKEKGVWFYAADMDGESLYKTELSGAVGIVMGSEGFGISRLVKEKCDFVISIPQYGCVNSMNVSCAAAVIMTEAARQRH